MTRVRRCHDIALISQLDAEIFTGDDPVGTDYAAWWTAVSDSGEHVAFAGARAHEHGVYMIRCGVLPEHRGQGLQKRLIGARCRWARGRGPLYTYTLPFNVSSANNLISCGFRMYRPQIRWLGDDVCYWAKYQ